MSLYLIAYDIATNKVRAKVHKYLSELAFSVQYSVFLFDGCNQELQTLLTKLKPLLQDTDQLLCITVNSNGTNIKLPPSGPSRIYIEYPSPLLNQLLN